MMANKRNKTQTAKKKVAPKKRPSSSKKEANISKEGKSYRVRISIEGERISQSFRNKKEAISFRNKMHKIQSKIIKIKKVVVLPKSKKKKVTRKAIESNKLKIVNPKTGRKKIVKAVKGIEDLPITKPQLDKFKKNKGFGINLMDGRVVAAALTLSEDQSANIQVRYSGDVIQCDSDQLAELVNLLTSEYYDYARDNDIDSPTIRWHLRVEPFDSITLNLDKTFFSGDEDSPFDVGFYFFEWSNQF